MGKEQKKERFSLLRFWSSEVFSERVHRNVTVFWILTVSNLLLALQSFFSTSANSQYRFQFSIIVFLQMFRLSVKICKKTLNAEHFFSWFWYPRKVMSFSILDWLSSSLPPRSLFRTPVLVPKTRCDHLCPLWSPGFRDRSQMSVFGCLNTDLGE